METTYFKQNRNSRINTIETRISDHDRNARLLRFKYARIL